MIPSPFKTAAYRLGVTGLFAVLLSLATPVLAQTVTYDLATTSVMRLNLPMSQAVTVIISSPVGKVVAADPNIADAQPITDRSVYVVGKAFGTTTVNLFSADGAPVGLIAVQVGADTAEISRSIKLGVPDSNVKVRNVNGRVQLSGTVGDAGTMQKVLDIVGQYGSPAIINTMTLPGRQLGIQWGGAAGGFTAAVNGGPNNPAGDATTFSQFITTILSGGGINLSAMINALEAKHVVRTLAAPNLTTLSGINASFLAGGPVPIRTVDDNGKSALSFKDFGVRLVFA